MAGLAAGPLPAALTLTSQNGQPGCRAAARRLLSPAAPLPASALMAITEMISPPRLKAPNATAAVGPAGAYAGPAGDAAARVTGYPTIPCGAEGVGMPKAFHLSRS